VAVAAVLLLLLVIAWPVGLVVWANGKIQHTAALSGAASTPGTTYLLAGSDSREDGVIEDSETVGARTDTILLLHVPESGPSALISLPRDSYVQIPGYEPSKLNAAYSWGGAPLLVQTVEQLTGMTVDHYVEVGFGGVEQIVDALGGVELCLDGSTGITFPVNDEKSGLVWDAPGCKTVDGVQALAFSRMRYADPSGDIGRGLRQRQLISAVATKAEDPSLLLKPTTQVAPARAR
jgi:LCP family protein required for cell wall assembly